MTLAQTALWALVALPAVAGGALVTAPSWAVRGRAAPAVGVGVAAVTSLLAVAVATMRPSVGVPFLAGSDLALEVDGLAAVVAPVVSVVATLALLGGAADVRESRRRFHGLMLVFTAAALLTVTATTLPTLLLAWEVMGATSYALIGFEWRERRRVASGLTAFLTTRAADLGLYVAAGAALAGGAGLGLADLSTAPPGWRDVLAAGVLVAALGKAAQLVLAFWLSRAMDGPAPVSALLHSAAMVAMGGYLLLRLNPLLLSTSWAGSATAWSGALTTVALGLVSVGQRDLKQLLAASTSAQLGFVVLAAGLGATTAGTAHLVAHAATKAALFLTAGAWLSALGTKALDGLRGAVGEWPLVRVAATVALLSLAGLPPLALWATKDLVLAAAFERSTVLGLVAVVGAGLSAAYAGVVLRVLWAPVGPGEAERARDLGGSEEEARGGVPRSLAAAIVALAAGAVLLGALAIPAVARRTEEVVGGPLVEPGVPAIAASGVLSVLVVAVLWWRPVSRDGRWVALVRTWGGVERAVHRSVVRPTVLLAQALDGIDRKISEGVIGLATAARRVASFTGTVDEQRIHGTVLAVAGAVRRAGRAARRPQTGQLHQYYVQAVALVAFGVVLLLVVR
ncbi:NADH-quinone oxidoreductase subunit L [Phycicoccus sp. MAQZ13P-2]|uniref:proton-conducting transporter transmembrane domain-containing protein n=1 Tax=Phycicoccus mangrovi TaxID=2840470 RepID=UPI001C006AA9|nr:proton-conducting transporter membrane subunit [Phycicoccus mangrovi]MBT9254593.1 NADH-quinone oxidoreductase subunit L [Phycicoccus mangrovi]MBT9273202.1 NADH-quinone oxidoreductase subunit L [Phycicoccus mangrovi]